MERRRCTLSAMEVQIVVGIRRLEVAELSKAKALFVEVFQEAPWHDRWTDEQLDLYFGDLMDGTSSLCFALYADTMLIGLCMGRLYHWYSGTEYDIREFCIAKLWQGKGVGRQFLDLAGSEVAKLGVHMLTLSTLAETSAYEFYQQVGFSVHKDARFLYKRLG